MDTRAINFSIRPARSAGHLPPLKPVVLAALAALAGTALAQPVTNQLPVRNATAPINATVGAVAGTAGNPVLPVTQQTSANNRAVVEWSSFNVGSGARVDFVQPNAQSVLLNRVVGGSGNSQIFGGLTANGRIFIVNPFGVYFGGSSQVNVGSLVASSLDLTPAMADNNYQGFLNGTGVDLAGSGQFGVQTASDSAANKITAAQGGSVALIGGGFVSAGGNIDAPGGRIAMAVAPAVRVVPVGQSGFVDLAITTPGASGAITVGGVLNASSTLAGTRGGQIVLQAPTITTYFGEPGESVLSADGPAGGGSITLGDSNTRSVTVEQGSILRADATDNGNGGSIAVRATYDSVPLSGGPIPRSTFGVAEVYGTLQARGGVNGGNGGRVETSGTAISTSLSLPGNVVRAATLDARARAATGTAGTWTLDPFDVTITNAATVAVNGSFQPTGPGANVRAADIAAALDAGTSVEINTGSATVGSAAGDITLAGQTAITRNSGTVPTTLTLRAHGNVTMAAGSSIGVGEGVVGPFNVNLFSDLDGNGSGVVSMVGASINTVGGNVTLSGGIDPATGFAAGNAQSPGVLMQGSTINTVGAATRGNVIIRGSAAGGSASAVAQSGVLINGGSSINAGNIAIHGQAGGGTAVRLDNAGLTTQAGLVELRGVATRNLAGTGQMVGVALDNNTSITLGTGSLLVAGRADENGLAPGTPAVGLRADDVRISGAAQSTGRVMLVGQSVGSTGPGIAAQDVEARGIDIAIDNDGSFAPIGANIVIGASAGAAAPAALGLTTGTLRGLTSGAVNLRPLGVDVAGNVVELPAVPIVIGAPSVVPAGSFGVDPALLRGPGVQTGGLSAGQGFVIGSNLHSGLITLGANSFPSTTLALTLQNQGAGSAGMQLGGGNVLGTLALLTSGNVSQGGALSAQNLLVQGGTASRIDLSNPANQFGVLAFDPPQFLSVATQGNLTVDAASALGCNAATNALAAVNVTNSVAGAQTLLRSVAGDLRLNRSILLPTEGAGTLDLVTSANFVAGEGVNISGGGGSQWRVWTQAPANVTRGNLQAGNLYGCAYGDSTVCSLSGVAIPAGNRFMFVDRPSLTVVANPASGVAGQPIPTLGYTVTGVVNGDAPSAVVGGALATEATSASGPGLYAITQGSLNSPLGYTIQYQGANLTLSEVLYDIQSPSRLAVLSGFLSEQRSDVYGRNLSLPYICTAASITGSTADDSTTTDPLASEWGKVRGLPQLSGCLDVKDGGQCAAF